MARALAGRRLAVLVVALALAVVVAATLLLVAGRTGSPAATGVTESPPWPAFRDGKAVSSWSADGGGFRVVPTDVRPAVSARRMARVLAASDLGDTLAQRLAWGYGRVSIDDRSAMAGTPSFRHRRAWVVVLSGFIHGCPAMDASTTTGPTDPAPGYVVLVLDGSGTSGAVYTTAATMCGGAIQSQPQARPLTEVASLPWTLLHRRRGGAAVSVEVPTCTVDVAPQGAGYAAPRIESWQVLATRNLTGPRCEASSTRRSTVDITFLSSRTLHLEHGPVGLRQPAGPNTTGARLIQLVAAGR